MAWGLARYFSPIYDPADSWEIDQFNIYMLAVVGNRSELEAVPEPG